MISRAHGLVLSLLLGAASAAGAYAVITTAQLGDAETKPEVISSRQIALRAQKLDAWEASLRKTLKAKPPALPALNRYAAVTFVAAPGAASLPTPVPVARRAVQQPAPAARPKVKPVAHVSARVPPKRVDSVATPTRDDDTPESAAPVAAPAPSVPAPTPSPAPVVAAAAPAPVVAAAAPATAAPPAATTTTTPPQTLSVEQQCRQLLRAAEGKSEQVKQEAERQCEALKQAAEREREKRG